MEDQIRQGDTDPELDPEVAEARNLLFKKYVDPYLNMIYRLCIHYTCDSANVEENYTEVLVNFYRRIGTYNPEMSILTWLHIVTKRQVAEIERRRRRQREREVSCEGMEDILDGATTSGRVMGIDNYRELYNDDILFALESMKSIHRDAFLLQNAGYSLKEIVEIEFNRGTLKSRNVETVKSRLLFARTHMKNHLTRDGKRKTNQTGNNGLHNDNQPAG
jgi:RNA polymerase sigma factor (sigma-70 family)